jgi:hypothetical protein
MTVVESRGSRGVSAPYTHAKNQRLLIRMVIANDERVVELRVCKGWGYE